MIALALLLLAAAPAAPASPAAPAGAAPAARFEAANRAYLDRDFAAAARGYQELIAEGWESPALHVNLGNARLRLGRRGAAIASYSRALRLDPGDGDARANLELARASIVDELEREASPLVLRATERVPDRLALAAFGLGWVALWAGLAARRLALRSRAAGVLGAATLAAALAAAAGGALLAGKAAARSAPVAVVVVEAAQVREGPEPALRPSFDLHEGTEVRVLEVRGGAVRVRLGSGAEGWVAAADLEGI
jgi:tetratricopeptide (TPR) repeat protein